MGAALVGGPLVIPARTAFATDESVITAGKFWDDPAAYDAEKEENKAGRQDLVDSPLGNISFALQYADGVTKAEDKYVYLGDLDNRRIMRTPMFRTRDTERGIVDTGMIYSMQFYNVNKCNNATYANRAIPPNTTYKAREIYTENDQFDADDLKAVLYFGYGGPGYDRSLFPSSDVQGAMGDNKVYAYTAMMADYVYTGDWGHYNVEKGYYVNEWATRNLLNDLLPKILARKDQVPDDFKAFLLDSEYDGSYMQLAGFLSPSHISVTVTSGPNPVEGATFAVYSNAGCTMEKCRITTDATGTATTPDLPRGAYYLKQIEAPAGFTADAKVRTVTSEIPGMSHAFIQNDAGGVAISTVAQTVDAETGLSQALGSASLAGASYKVSFWPEETDVAVVSKKQPKHAWYVTSNEEGLALLNKDNLSEGSDILPATAGGKALLSAGILRVEKLGSSPGYLPTAYAQTATITGQDTYCVSDLVTTGDHLDRAQVVRGNLSFVLMDKDTGQPMPNVPFLIKSKTTGEAHIAVTNERGVVNTSAALEGTPNANDAALTVDGIDPARLDSAAGVWFSGTTDAVTEPQAGKGALPYDTYYVRQLPTVNENSDIRASFDVAITNDNVTVDMGGVFGKPLAIRAATTAAGKHCAPPASTTAFTTTLSYTGLTVGHAYEARAELHLRGEDGADEGVLAGSAPATTTFVPEATDGTVDVAFEADTSVLAGRDLVCFSSIRDDGDVISAQASIADESQTVHITKLSVSARPQGSDAQTIQDADGQAIGVSAAYKGLATGDSYQLVTTVHKKAQDGADAGVATDASGKELSFTSDFTAAESAGTAAATVTFDASQFAGQDVALCAQVFQDGELIAEDADVAPAEKTIHVATSIEAPPTGFDGTSRYLPAAAAAGTMTAAGAISAIASHAGIGARLRRRQHH